MRILFTKANVLADGSSESLTYQFATRLAARGHDVRVVCGQAFNEHVRFHTQGVEVIQVKPRGGLLGMVADASTLVDLMRVESSRSTPKTVTSFTTSVANISTARCRRARARLLPVVLTPIAHPGQFHGGDAPADFERYRRASAITTMTDWEREWYASHGIDPYRVITTGWARTRRARTDGAGFRRATAFPPTRRSSSISADASGTRAFIHLLDAAELVWTRHAETRFRVHRRARVLRCGHRRVRALSRRPHHRDRACVIGREVRGPRRVLAVRDAIASRDLRHRLLEAWLHEKPVIGGDIPPLREVIDHGRDGLVVRQKVEDIAGVVAALLDDPELRASMGKAGAAKLAAKWNWDAVMDRVESAYERAVGTHLAADEALA